tara:strand:+ start:846 stop:1052 length:207 start_codon:yes stop_codon:yes gene_type:complete
MDRAIEQVSGRIVEPLTMSEENAWRKIRQYRWNSGEYYFDYFWHNACTGEDRPITEEQFNNQSEPMPN